MHKRYVASAYRRRASQDVNSRLAICWSRVQVLLVRRSLVRLSLFAVRSKRYANQHVNEHSHQTSCRQALLVHHSCFHRVGKLPSTCHSRHVGIASRYLFLRFPSLASNGLSFGCNALGNAFAIFVSLYRLLYPYVGRGCVGSVRVLYARSAYVALGFFRRTKALRMVSREPPHPMVYVSTRLIARSVSRSIVLTAHVPSPGELSRSTLGMSGIFYIGKYVTVFSDESGIAIALSTPTETTFSEWFAYFDSTTSALRTVPSVAGTSLVFLAASVPSPPRLSAQLACATARCTPTSTTGVT